jgi:hypothetical protein
MVTVVIKTTGSPTETLGDDQGVMKSGVHDKRTFGYTSIVLLGCVIPAEAEICSITKALRHIPAIAWMTNLMLFCLARG